MDLDESFKIIVFKGVNLLTPTLETPLTICKLTRTKLIYLMMIQNRVPIVMK